MADPALLERKSGTYSPLTDLLPKRFQRSPNHYLPLSRVLYELEALPLTRQSVRRYKRQVLKEHHVGWIQGFFGESILILVASSLLIIMGSIAALALCAVASWLLSLFSVEPGVAFCSELGYGFVHCFLAFFGIFFVFYDSDAALGTGPRWTRTSLSGYYGRVPLFVTKTTQIIKARCPEARFEIEYFYEDPFLIVRNGRFGRRYYIEAWDEPGLHAKRIA